MLTIVIPIYNQAEYLKDALFGLDCQTDKDFKVIISDNCSTDDIDAVINKFRHLEMEYYKETEFLDKTSNWNRAVIYSTTEYTMMHHADDILLPNAIQIIKKNILNHPHTDIFHGRQRPMLADGSLSMKSFWNFPVKYTQSKSNNILSLLCPISIIGVTFKTVKFKDISGFNKKYQLMQDWYLYVNLLNSGCSTMYIPEDLGFWRTEKSDKDVIHLNNTETVTILHELKKSWLDSVNIRLVIFSHHDFYKSNTPLWNEYLQTLKILGEYDHTSFNRITNYFYKGITRFYIIYKKVYGALYQKNY